MHRIPTPPKTDAQAPRHAGNMPGDGGLAAHDDPDAMTQDDAPDAHPPIVSVFESPPDPDAMTQDDAPDAHPPIVSVFESPPDSGKKPPAKRRRRSRGEDSIYQRGNDGRWIVEVRSVRKTNGKPYYLDGKDRTRSTTKAEALACRPSAGISPELSRQTVSAYLADWLEVRIKPNRAFSTWQRYEQLARVHVIPEIGGRKLVDLTADEIDRMLMHRSRTGISPSTVGAIRTMLRKALNDAEQRQLIDRNPVRFTDPPKASTFEPMPLTEDELPRFLAAIEGDRLEAFFVTAATLGLREGELFGLQWADLDFDRGEMNVRRQIQREPDASGRRVPVFRQTKTHRSRRSLPMPTNVCTALLAHQEMQVMERIAADDRWKGEAWGNLVFSTTVGTPLDPSNVDKSYKQALEDAGIPKRRFHDLRATCATLLARLGVAPRDAQLILGHAQVTTTLKAYTRATDQGVRESVDRLSDFMRSKEGENR